MSIEKKGIIITITVAILLSLGFARILHISYTEYTGLEQEIYGLNIELENYTNEIDNINEQILDVQKEIKQLNVSYQDTLSEIEKLSSRSKYELEDVPYWESQYFIRSVDRTDKKPYDDETFNCAHYSQVVNNNAEKRGLRCALVIVDLSGPVLHALIAFDSTDRGIVYYEPQTDEQVNLQIGKDYWADCVVPLSNRYYYLSDPENIVEDFTLYW